MKYEILILPMLLFACDAASRVDLKCDNNMTVKGAIWTDRAELKIDGITRVLPLQGVFTDEPAAKYAPEYLSNPPLAMTVKNYVGLTLDEKKIDFAVYSRAGAAESYELEIEGKKWRCR